MKKSDFDETRWSLVQAAAVNPTEDSRRALSLLCHTYWHPVYAFVRRRGYDSVQSQDLTQGFFALLLEKNVLGDADRERGRFRSFLLTAVKNFLANQRDRACAIKRGGGTVAVSIDVVEAERWYVPTVVNEVTPERLYERRWALSILEHVMSRLRAEYAAANLSDLFESLSVFLGQDSKAVRYEELAGQLGIPAATLRMKVCRMKVQYRQLLRKEITETVSTPDEIDEEIRFLVSSLSD